MRARGALAGELGHYRTHALDAGGLYLRRKGLLGTLRHHRAGARRTGKEPRLKDGRAIFAAAEAGNETVLPC